MPTVSLFYEITQRYGTSLYEALRPEDHLRLDAEEKQNQLLFAAPGQSAARKKFVEWFINSAPFTVVVRCLPPDTFNTDILHESYAISKEDDERFRRLWLTSTYVRDEGAAEFYRLSDARTAITFNLIELPADVLQEINNRIKAGDTSSANLLHLQEIDSRILVGGSFCHSCCQSVTFPEPVQASKVNRFAFCPGCCST